MLGPLLSAPPVGNEIGGRRAEQNTALAHLDNSGEEGVGLRVFAFFLEDRCKNTLRLERLAMFGVEDARANFEDEAAERFGSRQVALAMF